MVRTSTNGRTRHRPRGRRAGERGSTGRSSWLLDINKRFYSIVTVGLIGLLAVLGWMYFRPAEGERQAAVCVLVVDRTGSSYHQPTQQSYRDLAEETIEGCRRLRASLAIYYFDNTNAKLQKAGDEQPFLLFRPPTRRERLGVERVDEAEAKANAAVAAVFSTPASDSTAGHGSDILTAVNLAAQSLQQAAAQDGVRHKYLVVLTDGYQTGPDFRLGRTFRTPQSRPDAVVEEVRALGLMPMLDGVKTSFVGVGGGFAGAQAKKPAWFESSVRDFWTQLVAEGGGSMCLYSLEPLSLPGKC